MGACIKRLCPLALRSRSQTFRSRKQRIFVSIELKLSHNSIFIYTIFHFFYKRETVTQFYMHALWIVDGTAAFALLDVRLSIKSLGLGRSSRNGALMLEIWASFIKLLPAGKLIYDQASEQIGHLYLQFSSYKSHSATQLIANHSANMPEWNRIKGYQQIEL